MTAVLDSAAEAIHQQEPRVYTTTRAVLAAATPRCSGTLLPTTGQSRPTEQGHAAAYLEMGSRAFHMEATASRCL